ncbi:hypothetical protein HPHPA16_1539 [Helicobacter pylori Hp A-16]|nr:hypothetical protein HPHPA16_1539 [Helicobacter pylori Hp A-16]
MDLIVIISLIIIDLLLLKQYNQQTNILLSFWSIYANECFFKECMFLEWLYRIGFNLKGIVLS